MPKATRKLQTPRRDKAAADLADKIAEVWTSGVLLKRTQVALDAAENRLRAHQTKIPAAGHASRLRRCFAKLDMAVRDAERVRNDRCAPLQASINALRAAIPGVHQWLASVFGTRWTSDLNADLADFESAMELTCASAFTSDSDFVERCDELLASFHDRQRVLRSVDPSALGEEGKREDADVLDPNGETGLSARKQRQLEKLEQALIHLRNHPEWTNEHIATIVGVHPGTLSKWPTFRQAVEQSADEGKRSLPREWRRGDTYGTVADGDDF